MMILDDMLNRNKKTGTVAFRSGHYMPFVFAGPVGIDPVNPAEFSADMDAVCATYHSLAALESVGIDSDEKKRRIALSRQTIRFACGRLIANIGGFTDDGEGDIPLLVDQINLYHEKLALCN